MAQPDRPYSSFPDHICELGRFCQKTGKGVYLYPDGRTAQVDPEIDALLYAYYDNLSICERANSHLCISDSIWYYFRSMKLSQLRYFVAVAERGGINGAARQLGVSQPSITRSIRELEHELGAPLFERVGTGMMLTDVGKAVLHRAVGVQSDVARIRDEVDQMTGRSSGTITVGLSFVAHAGLLPKIIEPFRRRAPNVRLEVKESLFGAIEPEIYNGIVDFYVGPMQPRHNFQGKLAIEPLFENRRQIFCRSDHPLVHARSLTELTKASWVTASVTPHRQDELAPLFLSYGLPPPHVAMNAQTFLSIMLIAASSNLLAMLPQQLHELLSIKSPLVQVPVAETLPSSTISIVRRAAVPLTPTAEMLSDLFRRASIAHAASLPDSVLHAR